MAYPVAQADPTSVIGRRVLAVLIDALIVILPAVLVASAEFEYFDADTIGVTGEDYCEEYQDQVGGFCFNANDRVYFSEGGGGAGTPLYWGLNFGLLVLLQAFTGWTPGKLVAGIRVVREDGAPPGFAKAFLRWILWIVDAFPYFIPGLVAFITALSTPGHRRVGDMVAKTFVVRASAAGSPVVVPGLAPAAPMAGAPWGAAPPPAAAPTTWSAPTDPTAAGWASPGVEGPAPAPSAEGPQWDPARGTYIQWDPAHNAWMQWDEGFKAWTRIPGQ